MVKHHFDRKLSKPTFNQYLTNVANNDKFERYKLVSVNYQLKLTEVENRINRYLTSIFDNQPIFNQYKQLWLITFNFFFSVG